MNFVLIGGGVIVVVVGGGGVVVGVDFVPVKFNLIFGNIQF